MCQPPLTHSRAASKLNRHLKAGKFQQHRHVDGSCDHSRYHHNPVGQRQRRHEEPVLEGHVHRSRQSRDWKWTSQGDTAAMQASLLGSQARACHGAYYCAAPLRGFLRGFVLRRAVGVVRYSDAPSCCFIGPCGRLSRPPCGGLVSWPTMESHHGARSGDMRGEGSRV